MKIFIDSAKLDEIEHAYSAGVIDGVTTNPSLIKKAVDSLKEKGEKVNMESYIKKILLTAKGTPVSLEVTTFTAKKMIEQGKALFKKFNPVAKNVFIKILSQIFFRNDFSGCLRNLLIPLLLKRYILRFTRINI